MSYDELQISSLVGVSTPTYFINNGCRSNCGKSTGTIISWLANSDIWIKASLIWKDDHEEMGYLSGLIGARFEKKDKMESQHMLVQKVYLSIWYVNGYFSISIIYLSF